jgi:hypothetical protein
MKMKKTGRKEGEKKQNGTRLKEEKMAPYLKAVMIYARIMNNETFSNTYQKNGKIDPKKYEPKQLIDCKTLTVETFKVA